MKNILIKNKIIDMISQHAINEDSLNATIIKINITSDLFKQLKTEYIPPMETENNPHGEWITDNDIMDVLFDMIKNYHKMVRIYSDDASICEFISSYILNKYNIVTPYIHLYDEHVKHFKNDNSILSYELYITNNKPVEFNMHMDNNIVHKFKIYEKETHKEFIEDNIMLENYEYSLDESVRGAYKKLTDQPRTHEHKHPYIQMEVKTYISDDGYIISHIDFWGNVIKTDIYDKYNKLISTKQHVNYIFDVQDYKYVYQKKSIFFINYNESKLRIHQNEFDLDLLLQNNTTAPSNLSYTRMLYNPDNIFIDKHADVIVSGHIITDGKIPCTNIFKNGFTNIYQYHNKYYDPSYVETIDMSYFNLDANHEIDNIFAENLSIKFVNDNNLMVSTEKNAIHEGIRIKHQDMEILHIKNTNNKKMHSMLDSGVKDFMLSNIKDMNDNKICSSITQQISNNITIKHIYDFEHDTFDYFTTIYNPANKNIICVKHMRMIDGRYWIINTYTYSYINGSLLQITCIDEISNSITNISTLPAISKLTEFLESF